MQNFFVFMHFPELSLCSGGQCGFVRKEGMGIGSGGRVLEDQADVFVLTQYTFQHVGRAGAGEGFEVGEDENGNMGFVGTARTAGRLRQRPNRLGLPLAGKRIRLRDDVWERHRDQQHGQ